jgi:hypothetical protein
LRGGGAISGEKVEDGESAEDGVVGGIEGEELEIDGAGVGVAMAVEKFGVGAEGGRVLGRILGGLLQTLAGFEGLTFVFELPGFAGEVLRRDQRRRKKERKYKPREPHRYSLLPPRLLSRSL